MKIHEYQAKELFKKYQIPIPSGGAAFSVEEARKVAAGLGGWPVVVKAQIHAGGRGKGGGVKLARSADEVNAAAGQILGMTLVTHQTGPEGRRVRKVLVEQGLNIQKELYLSIIPDRVSAKIVLMASEAGGMDIEEVAATTPERIFAAHVDPAAGLWPGIEIFDAPLVHFNRPHEVAASHVQVGDRRLQNALIEEPYLLLLLAPGQFQFLVAFEVMSRVEETESLDDVGRQGGGTIFQRQFLLWQAI